MAFTPLQDLLPELAYKEVRIITLVENYGEIPKDSYGLVEAYCDEINCDCRRVMLSVHPLKRGPIAVIAYGWESKFFYARWYHIDMKKLTSQDRRALNELKGPCLNSMSPQSKLAPYFLKLVTEYVLEDQAYVERLKRHYKLFKAEVKKHYQK